MDVSGAMSPDSHARRFRALRIASLALVLPLSLVWVSGPDMFIGSMLPLMVVGWTIVVGAWSAAAVGDRGTSRRWSSRCMKLVAPVALITSLILGAFGVPGKIRLAVSAPALAQAGKRVLEGEEPKTARLYGFRETREQHGCAILTTQAIFIDEYGWAYCPQGPPPAYSKETFLPVGRDLYRYTFAD